VNCPPIGVDWPFDDSSCYVAGAILARDVGRDPRTTSIESRQTKRMDEAFVRRIKRHYVRFDIVTEAKKRYLHVTQRSRRAKFQTTRLVVCSAICPSKLLLQSFKMPMPDFYT